MLKAIIVDEVVDRAAQVRDALADVGCVDLETMSLDAAIDAVDSHASPPAVIVVAVKGEDVPRLHRLARAARYLPIVAICEERYIDAVLLAGAVECAVTPLRPRELVGRVRSALRDRIEERKRVTRERNLSDAIAALKREKEDLERVACVDALTGVSNRRHALSLLSAEWRRALRDHKPLGLVMVDLDCYHQYNEQYGHLGGDRCLQLVSEAMVQCLHRPSDYLGRYGGEEFIAVLPNTDAVGAKTVAERLRAGVEALAIPHDASACAKVVTITAGFASLHVTGDLTMDRLIAVADAALLRAKASGRNRVEGDAPLVRPARVSAQRWQRHPPVHADPWFADRIPGFLANAGAGARAIVHALRHDDPSAYERIAEPLVSSARELGLPTVERMIGELRRAAGSADISAARDAADEVIEYVTHVQVIYRRPSEPAAQAVTTTSA